MSEPRVRALIFDYDGLIVDSERQLADCFGEVMSGVGATVTVEEIGHLFGSTEMDHPWDELITARCDRTVDEIIALMTPIVRAHHDELPLLPGVRDLLDVARERDWRVGLATGQDLDRLPGRLARLEIHEAFDAIVTAEASTVPWPVHGSRPWSRAGQPARSASCVASAASAS